MEENNEPLDKLADDQINRHVEFFSTEDDKLKFLGEILSNESSRLILTLIIKQEMSADEISKKTNLRLSLVIHHLNKMKRAGIVTINKIGKNTKNHDVKYYVAKPGILILPKDASFRASRSKTLNRSIKKILRFATIGFAGLISWMITKPLEVTQHSLTEPNAVPDVSSNTGVPLSLVISLIVITVGLVLERIWVYAENKDKT